MRFDAFRRHFFFTTLAVTVGITLSGCGDDGSTSDPLTVATAQGKVHGLSVGTGQAATLQYLGIPYAAPPIGSLRWAPPAPAASWTDTRDATKLADHCAQPVSVNGIPSATEDCLYLNVFEPAAPGKYPVMVWVHGGSFQHNESDDYDATALSQKGVVVVTINYRIGAFGFMAHPALAAESPIGASGNYGLMDQQAALRWVRANIAAFQGDASNVTLFGESAGGYSVMAQLASPGASGLFDKAIIQSGYSLDPTPLASAESAGMAFATAAGCASQTAACLRALSTAQVLQFESRSYTPDVDGQVLTQSMRQAYTTGQINKVPVIQMSNQNENAILSALQYDLAVPPNPITAANYAAVEATVLAGKSAAAVDALYPLSRFPTATAPTDAIDAIATDNTFACVARSSEQLLSRSTTVFAAEFNDPNAPMIYLPPTLRAHWGAYRSADPQYFFRITYVQQPTAPAFTPAQLKLSDDMMTMWVRFATTGNPNASGSSAWMPFSTAAESHFSFDPAGSHAIDTFGSAHQCVFWTGS